MVLGTNGWIIVDRRKHHSSDLFLNVKSCQNSPTIEAKLSK